MTSNGGDRLQRSPIHLLHRAAQAADDIFSSEMRLDGLTPRQLAILLTVAENEDASQSALCKRTGVDRSTMADIVQRLKKRGLLKLRRSPSDQRAYRVRLTEKGQQILRAAEPLARKIDERVLSALPVKSREQFIGALQTMVTILQSTSPKDGSVIVR